jgi:type II secretory pathway component PulC
MQVAEFSSRGVRAGAFGWLVLVASVLSLMFAYWFWAVMFRPSSLPPILGEGRPDKLAKQVQARHLFGSVGSVVAALSAVPDAAQMVLAGIVSSGSSKHGVAVILIEGKKAVTVKVGQEIVPDVILSRVAHDHVELTRRGQTINLRLATKK